MASKIKVDELETTSGSGSIAINNTLSSFTSTGIDDNATSTAITINSSENVGIGTTSPGTKLSFDENTDAIIGLNYEASGGNGGSLQVRAGTGRGSGNTGGNLNLCSGTGTASALVGDINFGRGTGDNTTILPDETWLTIKSDGRGLSQFTAKAWINFNGTGTVAIRDSHNISSITDNGTGDYTVHIDVDMANTNYAVVRGFERTGTADMVQGWYGVQLVGSFRQQLFSSGSLADSNMISCVVFGD